MTPITLPFGGFTPGVGEASGGAEGARPTWSAESSANWRLRSFWCAPTIADLPHTSYPAKSRMIKPNVIRTSPAPRLTVRTTLPNVGRVCS